MSLDSDSVNPEATLPYCCIECYQAYIMAYPQEPLETDLSRNDSLEPVQVEQNNNVDRIASTSTKDVEPSKSISRRSGHVLDSETNCPNVSRNNSDDPVPTQPRPPRRIKLSNSSGERGPENNTDPSITSIPTQGRGLSSRAPGLSHGATKPPKRNGDLPPIPTQDTSSSNHGLKLQDRQEIQGVAKPQDTVIPSSVQTEERNDPQTQRRRETPSSPNVNKPQDRVELHSTPSVPIQRSQSNHSQTRSRTRFQPQETKVSSNVNKESHDPVEHPISILTQGQDRSAANKDTRPSLIHGTPSQMDTQYVNMLLALDDIPKLHNIFAAFFNWILLAGFILFPGTFTSLKNLGASGPLEQRLVDAVTSIPLFVIAWLCTGIGATGMVWLWWRWRKNYIWALNKIFTPGALNSLAGFISTMANIFGAQHGELSTNSKITVVVTAASTVVLGTLTAIYSFWLVRRVKSQHDREVGKQRAGKYGEGVVDLSKRRI